MDDKLKTTIEKIVRLASQNAEFDVELRKRLGTTSPASVMTIDDVKLDEIYEYCIEKVVRKQAADFYSDFPLTTISSALIDDFCRMESFRRKDNFGDFCLSLYQQIECITNTLCNNRELSTIVENMMGYPAYIKSGKYINPTIEDRIEGDFTIAALLFPGKNRKTSLPYSIEKSKIALQSQYAIDKVRIVVYFLGYRGMMKSSDFDSYKDFTAVLSDIYMCRNTNHRGNTLTQWEQETLDRVLPNKGVYYLKFLGALTEYVDCITKGYAEIHAMYGYAQNLKVKQIQLPGPKILGQIDLPNDGKKRFK